MREQTRARDAAPHNLPARLTSFVGRERETEQVGRLLPAHRLVTLAGSPGVGKTRLALRVAASLLGARPDGAWLVELAPLADPALVPQAVAGVLGIREQPGRPFTVTLADALRSRSLLLLLDNCEHLIEAVAALTDTLLRSCPDLWVLTTSREPLAIDGEVTHRVPSLSLPDAEHLRPAGVDLATLLDRSEALRLFEERAHIAAPAFALTAQNAAIVADICRRLDGSRWLSS